MKQAIRQRKDAVISLRVSATLKAALTDLASAQRRPLAEYVENILEDHVAERQQQSAKRRT